MSLDPLLRAATSHVESVRVSRTGINPLLWVLGLVALPSLVLSVWVGDNWLRVALFCLAALTALFAIGGYFVLLFFRPEMLQSEEYRLRRDALVMIFKRSASPETLKAASELVRMENSASKRQRGEKQ